MIKFPTEISHSEECAYNKIYADVFYLYMGGITPVTILGIVLNVINLIVLRRMKNMTQTSVLVLRMLTWCDLCFLISCFVFFSLRHMMVYFSNQIEVFARADNYIGEGMYWAPLPFYNVTLQTRNWLVVLVTFERCLNIVFPLWARGHFTKRNIIAIAIFVFSLSVVRCVIEVSYLVKRPAVNPCSGETQVWYRYSFPPIYGQIMYTILVVLCPIILVCIMNIVLLVSLKKSRSKRCAMNEGSGRKESGQAQATAMIVSVCILYTVCETPAGLDRFVSLAGVEFSAGDHQFRNYSRKTGLLLTVIDSAVNFFAYCISNRTFRNIFLQLFRGKKD
jgi:hypothetical protein